MLRGLDFDQSPFLHELEAVFGLCNCLLHLLAVLCNLLAEVIVALDSFLVGDFEFRSFDFKIMQLLLQARNAGSALELEETMLKHELGRNTLDSHQIQNHVVAEVKRRVQIVLLTTDNVLCNARLHLLLNHHNDNTTLVKAATTCTSRHLDEL